MDMEKCFSNPIYEEACYKTLKRSELLQEKGEIKSYKNI